jgi:ubiquinone/menaquinone biosynthesis C-methylase UbiE
MATRGPARRLFDLWSLIYDQPVVQRLTYRPVHDAVLAALHRLRPRRVLDLGCGTGLLSARLAGEIADVRVVGCDYSNGMLRHAAARSHRAVWVQGDALQLPFRAASFDTVVSTEAFHWFPDQAAALAEMHRVLLPGGRVLVALINPPLEAVGTGVWLGSRLVGQPFYWPTRRRMRELLAGAGFRVESQRRVWRLPAALALPPVLTVGVRE